MYDLHGPHKRAGYIFIYLFTCQFVLTAVWLCKVMLEDRYNNISYESVIPYYRTEGVLWCENFCKSDNELLTHTSTNKCTILYTVCFPGNLLLHVSVRSSYSGSFHQCCLNLQQQILYFFSNLIHFYLFIFFFLHLQFFSTCFGPAGPSSGESNVYLHE